MKKILIVDDEFIVRMGIRSILNWEEHGYTIAGEAADGEMALKMISAVSPDLVLTDLVMENMDGLELIRQCKRRFPQIKFVVLSNYNDFDNVKTAMKLGASDYIFKMTAQPEEILKILDEVSASIGTGNHAMDTLVQRNRQAIKRNVLYKCINHRYMDYGELEAEFDALRLDVDLLCPFVMLYFIIRPQSPEDRRMLQQEDNIQLVQFAMENIADELLKVQWKADTFTVNQKTVVSVINLNSDSPYTEERDLLKDKFRLVREYCRRYLNLAVYGVLSDAGAGYEQMKELHFRCMEAEIAYSGEEELITCDRQRPEILKARKYIDSHLQDPLTVGKVAQVACMSESYFSSVFKKEVGISFIDYVNQVRIRKAAELLRQRNIKIYEICQQVGIDNPNYFSVLFKKVMGMSPNSYRNEIIESVES